MKRDIAEEEAEPSRRTSTLTKRLAHSRDGEAGAKPGRSKGGSGTAAKPSGRSVAQAAGSLGPEAARRGPDAAPGTRRATTPAGIR